MLGLITLTCAIFDVDRKNLRFSPLTRADLHVGNRIKLERVQAINGALPLDLKPPDAMPLPTENLLGPRNINDSTG